MNYLTLVQEAGADAQRLENVYQSASLAGDGAAFGEAVHTCYAEAPANLLYAAWHFRLSDPDQPCPKACHRLAACHFVEHPWGFKFLVAFRC